MEYSSALERKKNSDILQTCKNLEGINASHEVLKNSQIHRAGK